MKDRKKIEKLLSLCLDLNPTNTNYEVTGEKPTVFFSFSGHVSMVTVSVHLKGWSPLEDPSYYYRSCISGWERYDPENKSDVPVTIDDIISDLERLKEENV